MSIATYPPQNISTANAVLGHQEVRANQGGITSAVDLTGLSVTVYVQAGHCIRISGLALISSSVADDSGEVYIYEDGVRKATSTFEFGPANRAQTFCPNWTTYPTAGTHTYKLVAARFVGTGTLTLNAGDGYPAWILVEDITGGTGGPGPILLGKAENFGHGTTYTNTITDIPGGSVTVNVPAGRTLRIKGKTHMGSTVATDRLALYIREGTTVLNGSFHNSETAARGDDVFVEAYAAPTSGVHTYKLSAARDAGTGTGDIWTSTGVTSNYLVVEDITGTEAPTGAYYEALWTPVTAFLNGWVNYGGWASAAYRKVNDLVYLRGLLKNGTAGTTMFMLPVGYRPAGGSLIFPTITGEPGTLGRIDIQGSGEVTHAVGITGYVTLSGIVFGVT